MSFTHIDCFSGPGGICTGMHAAGFDTKVAIEFIKSCCETYSANHPEVHVIHSDIRKVMAEDILPYIPKDGVDLVTSGMGWTVLRFWGIEIKKNTDECVKVIEETIFEIKLEEETL